MAHHKMLARNVPIITVRNTSDRPVPIKSKETGDTVTIMAKKSTQIAAHFASAIPATGPVRRVS